MATTSKTIAKVLLIPVLIVIGLELFLQLAALVVAATGRDVPTGWSTTNTHVLAMGDSNTFGIWLKNENDAYPSQLESLWNKRHPDNKIEVLNLGYPGKNSFEIAEAIEDIIANFKPDVVLLTVGVNDMYTAAEYINENTDAEAPESSLHPINLLEKYSRLYKLIYIAKQGATTPEQLPTENDFQKTENSEWNNETRDTLAWSNDPDERLQNVKNFKTANNEEFDSTDKVPKTGSFQYVAPNLSAIEEQLTQSGATFYLMTYASPAHFYGAVNDEIREYTKNNPQVRFVDIEAGVEKSCGKPRACEKLFFKDQHPNALGYAEVANIVADRFEQDEVVAK